MFNWKLFLESQDLKCKSKNWLLQDIIGFFVLWTIYSQWNGCNQISGGVTFVFEVQYNQYCTNIKSVNNFKLFPENNFKLFLENNFKLFPEIAALENCEGGGSFKDTKTVVKPSFTIF